MRKSPFCQKCGKDIVQGAQYCPSCGTSVSLTQQAPAYFPQTSPQNPKSHRDLIIIIVAIVLFATIVGGVAAYVFVSSVAQPMMTVTNVQMNEPQGQYDASGNCVGETLTFSFTLTNSGTANGYAHLVLLENNQTQLWNNNYHVDQGQSLPTSGSTFRQSCTAFNYLLRITTEWKG